MHSKSFDCPPDAELRRALSEFVRAYRAAKLPVPADLVFILPASARGASPDSEPFESWGDSTLPAEASSVQPTPSSGGLKHIQLQSFIAGRWVVVGDMELLPDDSISVSDTPEAIRVVEDKRGVFNPDVGRAVTSVEPTLFLLTLVKFGSGRSWRAVDYHGSDALPEETQSVGSGADWWRADSRRW